MSEIIGKSSLRYNKRQTKKCLKCRQDIARIAVSPPTKGKEETSSAKRKQYGGYLGGYEFEFVQGMDDSLEDMFMCKICHLPSRDFQLSVCCGHTFCKSCLEGMKRSSSSRSKVCPVCRNDKRFEVVPNKQVDRKIRSLYVFWQQKERL